MALTELTTGTEDAVNFEEYNDAEINLSDLNDDKDPIDQSEDKSFLGLTSELMDAPKPPKRSVSPIINQIKDKGILIHGL